MLVDDAAEIGQRQLDLPERQGARDPQRIRYLSNGCGQDSELVGAVRGRHIDGTDVGLNRLLAGNELRASCARLQVGPADDEQERVREPGRVDNLWPVACLRGYRRGVRGPLLRSLVFGITM